MRQVTKHVASRGIWVMDRGGDRRRLMRVLLRENRRFLIRLVGNRHLLYRGKAALAQELARDCKTPFAETIEKIRGDGRRERLTLEYGAMPVRSLGAAQTSLPRSTGQGGHEGAAANAAGS